MRPIRRVLVANRGEIARRVFRTCHELGYDTVAVIAEGEGDAPFGDEGRLVVRLAGRTPAESYLRAEVMVAAALASGADAVHPGYGFLSEDAGFAQAVLDAGLTWIGPPPAAIAAMGSKLGAKGLMLAAGVPCLPGVDATGLSPDGLLEAADGIGYPVLVKASAGGGGRGMRVVASPADLADAVASAGREAASAFGDGTVFLERFVTDPRHIEVQVLADEHGAVAALFERECSVQRRHQKVIEEAPSPAVDPDLRARLSQAAVDAARAVGYRGAGTVEFVLAPDGSFAFLEMNTRLQVEHPVTELITGLDLVALQLHVAEGGALPAAVLDARLDGHAVEARLYAEDVPAGYLPCSGRLSLFEVPTGPGIRVDSAVETGTGVGVHFDAMLAKVVAHGATRAEACRRLASVLRRARIHGVTTNRDLLVRVLESEEFLDGGTDTGFLGRHDPAVLGGPLLSEGDRPLHALAAALAGAAARRATATVQRGLPSGWRNVVSEGARASFGGVSVAYGEDLPGVRVVSASPSEVELESGGVCRRFQVRVDGATSYVDSPLGSSVLVEDERFPAPSSGLAVGTLTAPMPGTVVRVDAAVGAVVAAGDVLVVLEAMKMEHAVRAPADGVVTSVATAAGDQVQSGAVLVVVGQPED